MQLIFASTSLLLPQNQSSTRRCYLETSRITLVLLDLNSLVSSSEISFWPQPEFFDMQIRLTPSVPSSDGHFFFLRSWKIKNNFPKTNFLSMVHTVLVTSVLTKPSEWSKIWVFRGNMSYLYSTKMLLNRTYFLKGLFKGTF